MADNVNTFGTDMQSVQYAFSGFSKQNYTMLDNLKLGYGGTKAEMERLIDDANAYAEAQGYAADLSIDSFADIVQAIQYVQEEQGIAGTTAREASGTISGSIEMTKAAWDNFLVSLAAGDGMTGEWAFNLADSVASVAENVIPRVGEMVGGVVTAIPELVSTVAEVAGPVVSEQVGILVEQAKGALVERWPVLGQAFDAVDSITAKAGELGGKIASGVSVLSTMAVIMF